MQPSGGRVFSPRVRRVSHLYRPRPRLYRGTRPGLDLNVASIVAPRDDSMMGFLASSSWATRFFRRLRPGWAGHLGAPSGLLGSQCVWLPKVEDHNGLRPWQPRLGHLGVMWSSQVLGPFPWGFPPFVVMSEVLWFVGSLPPIHATQLRSWAACSRCMTVRNNRDLAETSAYRQT